MAWLGTLMACFIPLALTYYHKARPAPAGLESDGWYALRPRPVVPATILICVMMLLLVTGLWLTGAGRQEDGEAEAFYIGLLIAGFGAGAVAVAWSAYWKRLSWRDRRFRITTPQGTAVYDFSNIVDCETWMGGNALTLRLRDGSRIYASVYEGGFQGFKQSVERYSGGQSD